MTPSMSLIQLLKNGIYRFLNLRMQGFVHRWEILRENNQREDFSGWQEENLDFEQFLKK